MKRDYNFTPLTFNKLRHDHFIPFVDEILKLEPITPWESIKEGDVYHIPYIIAYKRADIIVTEKKRTYLNGMIREDGGDWKNYSLFKNEARAKFLVKKIKINNN